LVLKPNLFYLILGAEKRSFKLYFLVIVVVLVLVYVESFLSRRASFVIIGTALFFSFYNFSKNKLGVKLSQICSLILLVLFVFSIRKYQFTGPASFDIEHMVMPRLNMYITIFNEVVSSDFTNFLFGYQSGWAFYHNSYLDILVHSGFVGIFLTILAVIFIVQKYIKLFENMLPNQQSLRLLTLFFCFCVMFDNFINCAFSTPSYTVSVFIIFLAVLLPGIDAERDETFK